MPSQAWWIAVIVCLVLVVSVTWSLQQSGILQEDWTSFSLGGKIERLFSGWFLLTVVLTAAAMGWIGSFPFWFSKSDAQKVGVIGSGVGLIIAGSFFAWGWLFWMAAFFWIAASLWAIQSAFWKNMEAKNWVSARVAWSAGRGLALGLGIGLFALSAMIVVSNYDQTVANFEDYVITAAVPTGNGVGTINSTLINAMVENAVQNQDAIVSSIISSPAFVSMQSNPSTENQEFGRAMLELQNRIRAPGYREQLRRQAEAQLAEEGFSGREIIQSLKQQFPFLVQLEQWLWLVVGLGVMSVFLGLAPFTMQVLAVGWALFFQRSLRHFEQNSNGQTKM